MADGWGSGMLLWTRVLVVPSHPLQSSSSYVRPHLLTEDALWNTVPTYFRQILLWVTIFSCSSHTNISTDFHSLANWLYFMPVWHVFLILVSNSVLFCEVTLFTICIFSLPRTYFSHHPSRGWLNKPLTFDMPLHTAFTSGCTTQKKCFLQVC